MTEQTNSFEPLDLSSLPGEVGSWVALIHEEVLANNLTLTTSGVPDIAALEAAVQLPDGEKVKLTAKLRDEAWKAYQALMSSDDEDEVSEYSVIYPIRHNGKKYEPASSISLTTSHAVRLLEVGAIVEPQETQS